MQNQKNMNRKEHTAVRQRKLFMRRIICAAVLGIIVIAAAVLCFMLMAPAFNVSNVVCEGNINISSEAIIETAAIQSGKNVFLTNFSSAKNRVKSMEYVTNAEIKRRLPDTVRIIVTEEQPSAYFSVGSQLVLTDLSGRVIEVVSNPSDAEQIINSKITPEEEEPLPTVTPETEQAIDGEDDNIWGYDDDGDPIYKINGGHYEFDEDGNRFFVDDSALPSESPEHDAAPESAAPENKAELKYDELPRTDGGRLIYNAPVIYGIDVKSFEQGRMIKSDDESKLKEIIEVINALHNFGMLKRATKIDAQNTSDVKVYIENRLEILYGSFEDFEYKTRFVSSVINENLSRYESAILDFRDSKLYVRSADTTSPNMSAPASTPIPTDTDADDTDGEEEEVESDESDDEAEDDGEDDEDDTNENDDN